jgi:hypothetical protein
MVYVDLIGNIEILILTRLEAIDLIAKAGVERGEFGRYYVRDTH